MTAEKRDLVYKLFSNRYPGGNKEMQYEFSRRVAEERMDMWIEIFSKNERA